MSALNDLLNVNQMGEPQRLDYIIREHEKLQARVSRLEALLQARGLLSPEELAAVASPEKRIRG